MFCMVYRVTSGIPVSTCQRITEISPNRDLLDSFFFNQLINTLFWIGSLRDYCIRISLDMSISLPLISVNWFVIYASGTYRCLCDLVRCLFRVFDLLIFLVWLRPRQLIYMPCLIIFSQARLLFPILSDFVVAFSSVKWENSCCNRGALHREIANLYQKQKGTHAPLGVIGW